MINITSHPPGDVLTEEEVMMLINAADKDGDGSLDFQEFVKIMMWTFSRPKLRTATKLFFLPLHQLDAKVLLLLAEFTQWCQCLEIFIFCVISKYSYEGPDHVASISNERLYLSWSIQTTFRLWEIKINWSCVIVIMQAVTVDGQDYISIFLTNAPF